MPEDHSVCMARGGRLTKVLRIDRICSSSTALRWRIGDIVEDIVASLRLA